MCFDIIYRKVDSPAKLNWSWHSINRRDVAVSAVSIRLNEYRDVVSCFRSACVLIRGAKVGVVHTIALVLLVAYTPSEYIFTIKPAAVAA